MSQAQIATQAGMSVAHVSEAERGLTVPSAMLLNALAEQGFDVQYILTGQGPKYRSERLAPPTGEVLIVSLEEARERLKGTRAEYYVPVPLVADRAAAFDPAFVSESDIEGYAVIYKAWLRPTGRYSCVRIKGRSMLPVLTEGDIVAVNHARTEPEELNRKIIAVNLEQEGVTIRYLQVEPDRRHLVVYAENRAEWEPRFFEPDQVRVVGAVEWAWRKFE